MKQSTHDHIITILSFFVGIALSAMITIGNELLIPFTGAGYVVKRMVLGHIAFGIAAGNLAGAFLSRYKRNDKILLLFEFTAGVILMLLPWISSWTFGITGPVMSFQSMFVCGLAILFFPVFLISALLPLTIASFKGGKAESHAKKTGIALAVIMTGAASGCILYPFIIIPKIGLIGSALFTGFILSLYPGIQLFRLGWKNPGIMFLLIACFIPFGYLASGLYKLRIEFQEATCKISPDYSGKNGKAGNEILLNGLWYAHENSLKIEPNERFVKTFIKSVIDSYFPESRMLIFGIPDRFYIEQGIQSQHKIILVEENQMLSKIFFSSKKTSENIRLISSDVRRFINENESHFDLMLFDVFRGDEIPEGLFNAECIEKIRTKLNPDGSAIIPIPENIRNDSQNFIGSVYKTIRSMGLFTEIISPENYPFSILVFSGSRDAFLNHINQFSGGYYPADSIRISEATILTDDKPVVGFRSREIMAEQRKYRWKYGEKVGI